MSPSSSPPARPGPGLRRGLLAGAAALTVLGLAGAVVAYLGWTRRTVIGAELATRYLADRGIPARIRIRRLDAHGFAARISLGPPGRPDLEVDEVTGAFAAGPALGPVPTRLPRVTALTLTRPHLRARWDGRRLDLGVLQRLVNEAARAPKGGPAPDVVVRDARLELATPAGPLVVRGDGRLAGGRLQTASLTLYPARLALGDLRIETSATAVQVASVQGLLHLHGAMRATRAEVRATSVDDLQARFVATAPTALDGAVRGEVQLSARRIVAQGLQAQPVTGRLDVAGRWSAAAHTYHGRVFAAVRADTASGRGAEVAAPAVTVDSAALQAVLGRGGFSASGPVHIDLRAGSTHSRAAPDLRLASAGAAANGRIAFAGDRLSGALDLNLQLRGAVLPTAARRLTAQLAPIVAPGERRVLTPALGTLSLAAPAVHVSFGDPDLRIATARPVSLTAGGERAVEVAARTSNGDLTVRPDGTVYGGVALTLRGDALPHAVLTLAPLSVRGGEATAQAALAVQGDTTTIGGLDLAWRGRVQRRGEAVTFAAAVCAPLTARTVRDAAGRVVLRDLHAEFCPETAAPMLILGRKRTRAAARVDALAAAAPAAEIAVSQGVGRFALDLGARGPVGEARVDGVAVRDLAPTPRFAPLRLSGHAASVQDGWRGDLAVSRAAGGDAFATGRFTEATDGRGAFELSAPALSFASPGLQPADLSPGLNRYASQVKGTLAASVNLGWTRMGLATSRLELSTSGLDMRTPAGRLAGLAGRVLLQPLAPPVSVGVQRLTAASLQTPLPLTDLSAAVALDATGLHLSEAAAKVAGGRVWLEPLAVALAPGATLTPVLHLQGVQLGQVLSAFNLAQAISVKAAVSGVLPLSFGPTGVHVASGRLVADGPGELTLHRKALGAVSATAGPAPAPGAPPTAAPAPNAMQDLAFQALEHLAFTTLTAEVDSRAAGRLGVVLHIVGRHEPPQAPPPTRVGLFDLLRGKAFDKTLPLPKGTPIDLTLDTSLNFDDLLAQYGRLGRGAATGSVPVQP